MALFSGSLMTSDLGYQETEAVLLSRFNEMGILLWDSLNHPRATTYWPLSNAKRGLGQFQWILI
jgi:hypothetical protein